MANKKCERCGEIIDISACNQTYGILTEVRDTDAEGTKIKTVYLCDGCLAHLQVEILKD